MPNYRLYRLDAGSGRFLGVVEIQAADDEAAIQEIQQRGYGDSVELWDGGRKVRRIDALADGAAFARSPEGQPMH
ncbi:MAG TPA: hypothetical protein VK472_05200 [Allosphingosinicella sp.]|jgi:hypothetical protein|nr:hypothetical protein [Allosphingosinicella sp.]